MRQIPLKLFFSITIFFLSVLFANAREYHVSVNGSNDNQGTMICPFRTINAAAAIAKAGDTITVHAGTYRENVNPAFGGTSDIKRILYRSKPGDKVFIKGSELVKNWQKVNKDVWKVTLPNAFFGNYNPYKDSINADWFNAKGRVHHTGEVYMSGKSFFEMEKLDKVLNPQLFAEATDKQASLFTWYCESKDGFTTIWANFQGKNPNKELVEINVRPTCLYPDKTGINYITVRGFNLLQAATQWAPPTAEQNGIIGPHWAKGWIIEDNIVSDSKCVGISLGKERSTGQNFGVNKRMKSGFQYQLEVVFRAIQVGWSKETIGSHIVRNNTIYNCEQAGIVGHLGCAFSQVYNNHIYNIHTKKLFTGDETAGIKFHAAIDVLISNNRIHDNGTMAIWMDWQCQGTRITRNLLYNNTLDFMSEVNHGPYTVDNNIMLSPQGLMDLSQGCAFVNNLITGATVHKDVMNRYTPYHFPHSTQLAGTSTITGGDNRFYNNIFATQMRKNGDVVNEEALGGANSDRMETFGLSAYDMYAPSMEAYLDTIKKGGNVYVVTFATVEQPVWIASNLYFGISKPSIHDKGSLHDVIFQPQVSIDDKGEEVYLQINVNDSFNKVKPINVNTDMLGMPRISEVPFQNPDGTNMIIDTDYFGIKRTASGAYVGPFNDLKIGTNRLKVW